MDKTIEAVLHDATFKLRNADIAMPALDARLLFMHATGMSHEDILRTPTHYLNFEEVEKFHQLLARRLGHEPVSRIMGKREFWGLEFELNEATLDPRPDSETLIEAALDLVADKSAALNILDFGTGSGCLLLALLSELPNANGIGVDMEPRAIEMAEKNAATLNLQNRTKFSVSKWGENVSGIYDLIITNPPYIPAHEIESLMPEVKNYDPLLALTGGADGLMAYRAMGEDCKRLLAKNGVLIVEIGATTPHPAPIFAEFGLILTDSRRDLGDILRCLIFRHGDNAD